MDNHHYLQTALVFLLAAVIAVPVTKRFGLGAVLGYLLAGVAIGPQLTGAGRRYARASARSPNSASC